MRRCVWLLLALLACRELPEGPERIYEESFEDVCDGVPCGWTQIAGAEGAVTWVATSHVGEHGIRLEGDGATARSPMAEQASSTLLFGAVEAGLSARCEEGALLTVEAVLVDTATGNTDTFSGRGAPRSTWSGMTVVQLVGDRALLDGGLSGGMFGGTFTVQLTALVLRVEGPGACEIDHLVVDDVGAATGGPDPNDGC